MFDILLMPFLHNKSKSAVGDERKGAEYVYRTHRFMQTFYSVTNTIPEYMDLQVYEGTEEDRWMRSVEWDIYPNDAPDRWEYGVLYAYSDTSIEVRHNMQVFIDKLGRIVTDVATQIKNTVDQEEYTGASQGMLSFLVIDLLTYVIGQVDSVVRHDASSVEYYGTQVLSIENIEDLVPLIAEIERVALSVRLKGEF